MKKIDNFPGWFRKPDGTEDKGIMIFLVVILSAVVCGIIGLVCLIKAII